jgi:hypothetical protein
MSEFDYKAFITYSHSDAKIASWLQKSLESYRVPSPLAKQRGIAGNEFPRRLRPIFRDRVELPAGGTFTVAPQSSEEIVNVVPNETVPGATSSTYYAVTAPTPPGKVWSVVDTEHTDPNPNAPDTFEVYARDKTGDPIVMCDPIIRNKGN